MVGFDRSAFISKFQEEAQDLLQRLNEGVITLETDPGNRELIDQMLRDAHTLKGSSRMVGLIEISDIAHRLEDIMVKVREKQLEYTPEMSEHFFDALDSIMFLADNGGVNEGSAIDLDALQLRLTAVCGEDEPPAQQQLDPVTVAEQVLVEEGVLAEETSDAAPAATAAPVTQPASAESAASVPAGPAGPGASDELKAKVQTTIRVRTTQVDDLLNLISEVVIGQIKVEQRASDARAINSRSNDLWQLWSRVRNMLSSSGIMGKELLQSDLDMVDKLFGEQRRDLGAFAKEYSEDTARVSVVVKELQEQGMRLRMLPANTIFQAFPRAVRDLAKQFNKNIELIIEGGDTELDKKVLEEINDPLIHIMRNAVDHGIEDPETRVKMGKPAQGTVRLAARQEGDRIVIEVSDDGAGIDPEKVKASAIRKGYLTEGEATAMSDREALYLIFEAGFSTAAIITEISGRGVGMDVVREFIVEKLKGSLDVQSEIGKGTSFRLTIPLTLAIIRALLLKVGDQTYALPTASIEETMRILPEEIIKLEGRQVIRRENRTIPLVRLADILGVASDGAPGHKIPVVSVDFSGHRIGYLVDELVGEHQIVIKPLGSHLAKVDNIAGVTILGAGEIVPILNVPDLVGNARDRTGQGVRHMVRAEREGSRKVLICEDSFTTRELERSIFETAGYEVETAMDGAQGLMKLREGLKVDAVVTDVQMPNMTGFELTRAIKSDPVLSSIPVVIVTSLERDEEKAQGIEAGADGYITKSVFNQDTLLDTVDRLIR